MQVFLSLIVGSFLLQSFAASASLQTVHQDDGSNVQMTTTDKHQPDEEGIKEEELVNTGKETQPTPSNPLESEQSADETEVSAPVVTDSDPVTIPPVLKKESFRHCIETSTGNTFKWCLIEERPEGCPPQSYDTLNALFKGHFCPGGGGDSAVAKPEQVATTNPTANHHFMQFTKTFESFLGYVIGMTLDEVKKLDSFETRMVDIMNEFHKIRENITQELLSENQDAAGTKADEPKNVNEQENTGASPFLTRSLGTQSNQSNHEEKVAEPMANHKRPHPWVDNPFDLETETKVLDEFNTIKKAESNQSNHEEKVEEAMATHPIVPPLDKPKKQTIVEETETKVHDETKAVPINDPSKPLSESDPKPSSTIDAQIDTKNGLEEGHQEQDVDVMTDNLGQVAGRENKKDVQEIHSA